MKNIEIERFKVIMNKLSEIAETYETLLERVKFLEGKYQEQNKFKDYIN